MDFFFDGKFENDKVKNVYVFGWSSLRLGFYFMDVRIRTYIR